MCLVLCSRNHPDYPFILISNRDELFQRPTQLASFVTENNLLPVDLARKEHGTWIGVNRSGKFCVLVNYREAKNINPVSKISRGAITRNFLNSTLSTEDWSEKIKQETSNFKDVGGFSLLFGDLKLNNGKVGTLKVLSNRVDDILNVFQEENAFQNDDLALRRVNTLGLSNSSVLQPWPKVIHGEILIDEVIKQNVNNCGSNEDELIQDLFTVLCDTRPGLSNWKDLTFMDAVDIIPESIFVPPLKNDLKITGKEGELVQGEYYGTRTQTIILIDREGEVTYVEKNLHSSDNLAEEPQLNRLRFQIEDWKKQSNIKKNRELGKHTK